MEEDEIYSFCSLNAKTEENKQCSSSNFCCLSSSMLNAKKTPNLLKFYEVFDQKTLFCVDENQIDIKHHNFYNMLRHLSSPFKNKHQV